MGSVVMIEMLFSAIVGGMILIIMLNQNATSVKNKFDVQENLWNLDLVAELDSTLEWSFRQLGVVASESPVNLPSYILYADSARITFLGEFDTAKVVEGDFDECTYFLGDVSELSHTPNPNDRILYKTLSGCEESSFNRTYIESTNITDFDFTYLDKDHDTLFTRNAGNVIVLRVVPALDLSKVYNIRVSLKIENSFGYDVDTTHNPNDDIFTKKGFAEGYYKRSLIPTKLTEK